MRRNRSGLDFEGTTLSRRQVLGSLAGGSLLCATAGCLVVRDVTPETDSPPSAADVPTDEIEPYEQAIHDQLNDVRREHDLDTFSFTDEIAAVARNHSQDMADRDYFAHESPDGADFDDRLAEFVPDYCQEIGENIATIGLRSDDADVAADTVVAGWMDSPGHRENVLHEVFDEQGIGVAITEDSQLFATQKLCRST